jgi:hypothetical protein
MVSEIGKRFVKNVQYVGSAAELRRGDVDNPIVAKSFTGDDKQVVRNV